MAWPCAPSSGLRPGWAEGSPRGFSGTPPAGDLDLDSKGSLALVEEKTGCGSK